MADFVLFTVSGGSSLELYTTTGSGHPKLFEGSGMYIYGMTGKLITSGDSGSTFTDITPTGVGTVISMCQTIPNQLSFLPTTVVFGSSSGGTSPVKYMNVPEAAGAWSTAGAVPSGFVASSSICEPYANVPVLAGNSTGGQESRIVRSSDLPPLAFLDSDTGIPQYPDTTALAATRITCMDAAV